MGRRIILLAAFLLAAVCGRAIMADPNPATVIQPDGSQITVRVHGDEFFHYTTTADGRIVAQKQDGFYYYADYDGNGRLTISDTRAVTGVFSRSGASFGGGLPQSVISSVASSRRAQMARAIPPTTRAGETGFPPNTLVLLVEFSDVKFRNPLSEFEAKLNSDNYTSGGNTGSVKQYYADNSMGQYVPSFDVVGPITLNKPQSYYGNNDGDVTDVNVRYMVTEACAAVDGQVDFSRYDYNGDGFVDNLYIFYAGYSEAYSGAPASTIWPHQWAVTTNPSSPVLDGVRILTYGCSSELRGISGSVIEGIGAFCHEFGHILGLMDFYNVDGGGEDLDTVGPFSLMDSGNYLNESRTPPSLNAVEREMLGWLEMDILDEEGAKTLESIDKNKAYRFDTANPGEYFVVEARSSLSNWDRYIGYTGGVLIYHVDRSSNMVAGETAAARWVDNTINVVKSHYCMRLMAASPGDYSLYGNQQGAAFFPGTGGVTAFTASTTPGSVAWSGLAVGLDLTEIAYSELDGTASFTVEKAGDEDVILSSVSVGQKDAYVAWTTASPDVTRWVVEWKKSADEEFAREYTENKYYRFEGLSPATDYDVRIASMLEGDVPGNYTETGFKTAPMTSLFPAIGLAKSLFMVGETLALRVVNLPDNVSGIVWKLDGVVQEQQITFLAAGTHTLSCEITYSKGNATSTEIITRKLTVTQ